MPHPYAHLPARSFWRTAVADPGPPAIGDLWTPKFTIGTDDPVITAGSCFARHIGPALRAEGMNWYDAEPAPPGLTAEQREARGYGRLSFRTGTVHTAAALRQWFAWALGEETPPEEVWWEDGRCHDPYRPTAEPDGFARPEDLVRSREVTLAAVRTALTRAEFLVFTLGLTETWRDEASGTVLPLCPGTARGTFDPARHCFHNATVEDVQRDLSAALALARSANPRLRTVLTVSPVPLTATATGRHALVATTCSKSVLRAAAGQLADRLDHVDYFPSYELISGFPFRAAYYEPNLRTVSAAGVAHVMRHFFEAQTPARTHVLPAPTPTPVTGGEDPWCDDAVLDYYRPRPVPPAG